MDDFNNIILLREIEKKIENMTHEINMQRVPIPDVQLISETEVTKLLKVTKVTLNKWRKNNILIEGKHYMRIGKCLRYKKSALLNFSK